MSRLTVDPEVVSSEAPRDLRVLLVEDNKADARLVREEIAGSPGAARFDLVHAATLGDALRILGDNRLDAVLLDLGLPDAWGLEAVERMKESAPDLPIVVLSGSGDEDLALQAIRRGAQDYLVKGQCGGTMLERSLLYALERKRLEMRISHLAHYDGLTDVPNRRLFSDRLSQAMARARREGILVGLIYLDLDHFKFINDSLGHSVGDQFLQAVSRRLSSSVRESDTVARLGGDEFAVVLSEVHHPDDVALFADKIIDLLAPPFMIDGHELFITASMGISIYPGDGESVEELLRSADSAMYSAKQMGRNRHQMYATRRGGEASEKLVMVNNLRHALTRNELELYYQPQVDIVSGRLAGVEALLRWREPKNGLVGPADFIMLAEQTGLIVPIGDWVIDRACAQMRRWKDAGLPPLRVAVNVSSRQFAQDRFSDRLLDALVKHGVDPSLFELELTETGLMHNPDAATTTLRRLRAHGIRIAIDDFGTGYSSLSHLKRFPLDALKIDQSFLHDIAVDPTDAAIGAAIISMAHALGLAVIAEGVETAEHLDFLRRQHCDEAQGFYLSVALPAEVLERDLANPGVWKKLVHLSLTAHGESPPPSKDSPGPAPPAGPTDH